jgi:hypothetical protein
MTGFKSEGCVMRTDPLRALMNNRNNVSVFRKHRKPLKDSARILNNSLISQQSKQRHPITLAQIWVKKD